MRAVRVRLSSWTASFRYSGFMIGFQPTLPMPPLSTVYGIVSSAAGTPITPRDTFVGYEFSGRGRTVDLERIIEWVPGGRGKWNVIKREILCDVSLTLYLDPKMAKYFEHPHFPLLIGRSSDLASVDAVEEVSLERVSNEEGVFGASIYTAPPDGYSMATLYALPVYFTDSIPREAIGVRPFMLIPELYQACGSGYRERGGDRVIEIHTPESLGLSHQ